MNGKAKKKLKQNLNSIAITNSKKTFKAFKMLKISNVSYLAFSFTGKTQGCHTEVTVLNFVSTPL